MGIQGKRVIILRIIGMIILLIGIIFSIILDFLIITNPILNASIALIIILWFLFFFLVKLEINYFSSNFFKILIILCIFSSIIIIIFTFISLSEKMAIEYVFLTLSNILIILSWNYSLSIYKKQKIIFILGGIGYFLISLIFRIPFKTFEIEIIKIIALTLIIISFILICFVEIIMKKRRLLNYI